jgi:hypothetical protein
MTLKVGKADVDQDASAHTPGINQGNATGNYDKQPGHLPDGRRTASAATGVDPASSEPIDPRMPTLTPP